MSNLEDLTNLGNDAKYIFARTPTASEVGAQLHDLFVNSATGMHFICTDATPAAQVWLGTDGNEYPLSILSPAHPDLVAMYTMDNISGATLVDETANGRDGVITGATQVSGKIGNALDFESGQYVTLPTTLPGDAGTQGALSFWVLPETPANHHRVITASDTATSNNNFTVYVNGGMKVQLTFNTARSVQSDLLCLQAAWNHVVAQTDGTTWEIYIDGVLSTLFVDGGNTGEWFGDVSGVDNMLLGRFVRNTISETQPMKLDQVRLYNRPLIQSEVTESYQEGNP